MTVAVIGILMGSDSDWEVMSESAEVLEQFQIPFEVTVVSAHRTPERTHVYATQAKERGIKIVIAGAGAAAHLAGVVASSTMLPVIAVPLAATTLMGLDALLSTVQMPGGIPVATMSVGASGARNAALLALRILALYDEGITEQLLAYQKSMAQTVEEKDQRLQEKVRTRFVHAL